MARPKILEKRGERTTEIRNEMAMVLGVQVDDIIEVRTVSPKSPEIEPELGIEFEMVRIKNPGKRRSRVYLINREKVSSPETYIWTGIDVLANDISMGIGILSEDEMDAWYEAISDAFGKNVAFEVWIRARSLKEEVRTQSLNGRGLIHEAFENSKYLSNLGFPEWTSALYSFSDRYLVGRVMDRMPRKVDDIVNSRKVGIRVGCSNVGSIYEFETFAKNYPLGMSPKVQALSWWKEALLLSADTGEVVPNRKELI